MSISRVLLSLYRFKEHNDTGIIVLPVSLCFQNDTGIIVFFQNDTGIIVFFQNDTGITQSALFCLQLDHFSGYSSL
jgi:hypothetical protein